MEDSFRYPVEFLHTLNTPGIRHVLYLKAGALIMLLRTIIISKMRNGIGLLLKTLHKHVIEMKIFTGVVQGETVIRIRLSLSVQTSATL